MTLPALSLSLLTVAFLVQSGVAQHCTPITESYLSGIQLTRQTDGLTLTLDYSKTGGQQHRAYQAYLLAFSENNSSKIALLTPQQAIEQKLATVVETRLLALNEAGQYESRWELKTEQLVEQLLSTGTLSPERVNDVGGWKSFQDRIRLAVFIPFLEDDRYSILDELPDDRHECNYAGEAALLFETLPQSLTVCFGIVQAVRLADGAHYLELNGHRPPGPETK